MKKLFLSLIILIIFIQISSAININTDSEYNPEKTLISEISGNFLKNLKKEDIKFYREHREISLIYDLLKIDNIYYLYALLPQQTGNYSIVMENVIYSENNSIYEQNVQKNFSIFYSNKSVIQVNPGALITKQDFYLTFVNKGVKSENIRLEFSNNEKKASLEPNQEKRVYLSIDDFESGFTSINVFLTEQIYSIPIRIVKTQEIQETYNFQFKKDELIADLIPNKKWLFEAELYNYGSKTINNISLRVSNIDEIVKLDTQEIQELSPGSYETINLTVESDEEGFFKGNLEAYAYNLSTNLSLFFDIKKNQTLSTSYNLSDENLNCSEQGEICKVNQVCDGVYTIINNQECCIGKCLDKQDDNNDGNTWLGIIIISGVVLAIIGFFVFMRFKNKKSPEDMIKQKQKNFESKIKTKK